MNQNKLFFARCLYWTGLEAALRGLLSAVWGRHVRVVNYHDVPLSLADNFERQLRFFLRHFVAVTPGELEALRTGESVERLHAKPGLILTFDDGYRSHSDVVAPLLQKHGFVGWFFVPAAFPSVPAAEQVGWAHEHKIFPAEPVMGERVAMTWGEVRRLAQDHVVGCHAMHHRRLADSLTVEDLEIEIPLAKNQLEAELGGKVSSFGWVGGEEWSYSAAAADAIRQAGFRWSFMTNNAVLRPGFEPLQIQRTNIEANYPDVVTSFQVCGLLDLLYWPKRRRVNRITAADG